MKRDAATLAKVGEDLFGPEWQTPLARALGKNNRTVRRWASGETAPIPDSVWAEIAGLCAPQAAQLGKRAKALATWPARLGE